MGQFVAFRPSVTRGREGILLAAGTMAASVERETEHHRSRKWRVMGDTQCHMTH